MSNRSSSTVECAECGQMYTTLTQTTKRTLKRFGKYVCPDCAKILGAEKRKKSMLEKYGVENPMQVQEFKEKLFQSNLKQYGFITPIADPEIQEKIHQEYKIKTGYDNPAQNPISKEKSKQTCLERYGVEYAMQSSEIHSKAMCSAYQHGTVPTSKPQIECFNILQRLGYDVELNFMVPPLSLDTLIRVNDVLIDFEYDGWYWHQDKQKDCARNAVLMNLGYKIFRVKAFSDIIPSEEVLQEGIDILVNTDQKVFYKEIGENREK